MELNSSFPKGAFFRGVQKLLTWISKNRYVVFVGLLLVQVTAFSLQGIWVEDFWEHSAAVAEFMRNPISPSHPQLNIDAPHAFLNPYAFLVALLANALGLTPIIALSVFGIFNFCVFCIGVYVFSSNFYKQCPQKIAFYALLLILFLWGQLPWPYSGFFSYQIFLFNLPYPSTLIGGLCLVTNSSRCAWERNLSQCA